MVHRGRDGLQRRAKGRLSGPLGTVSAAPFELWWALASGAESGAFPGGAVMSVSVIGRSLFTDYAFPFEVTSILILVAMVGAVVLARRDHPRDRRDRGGV